MIFRKKQSLSVIAYLVSMSVCFGSLVQANINKASNIREKKIMPLAGQWRFQLDPEERGIKERWYQSILPYKVKLPGTTDENHKGTKNEKRELGRLSRVYYYEGAAWYQRDVIIPANWKRKHITLLLERSKQTQVWVDDKSFGIQINLSTPHIYDLTSAMTPGKHTLTICVNNQIKTPKLYWGHAVYENTQTNWNGIVGRIELQATDLVWFHSVQVYPDIKRKIVKVLLNIDNETDRVASGTIKLSTKSWNSKQKHAPKPASIEFSARRGRTLIETNYAMGKDVLLWDEFSPNMYKLKVSLEAGAGKDSYSDSKSIDFGMRDFAVKGTQFMVNGKIIFLRGKHDACVFPLTGYPPMDKSGWLRVFKIAKSYGINHYRFHTWCPPEAAFTAADQVGIYMQPESPSSSIFGSAMHDEHTMMESDKTLDTYGNHPSFCMFALGNEIQRGREIMAEFVKHFQEKDPRHLYAEGSNNFQRKDLSLSRVDDYWTTMQTKWDGNPVRGSFSYANDKYRLGHIDTKPPSTEVDYSQAIADIPVPVIGHEVGQYQVYPNFSEIEKYTGVLRARNFEEFRKALIAKHMLDQANDFVRASGALSVICYREDIEAALRTPGFGGFQLLDLQDYPGQGTALVGILDAFMDSKGLIKPEDWRRFCSETVPLILMEKYTWSEDEIFTAEAKVAHYGPADLEMAVPLWTIKDKQGRVLDSGELPTVHIIQGGLHSLGRISTSFRNIMVPQKLTLQLQLKGTDFVNVYDIWVYPRKVDSIAQKDVTVTREFDSKTSKLLAKGEKVLLLPEFDKLRYSVGGAFQPDFWCYPMFKRICLQRGNPVAPGTLGILCNPDHPALALFPTEFHSNWQWWHLVKNSRPIILDETPSAYRPIVQVIDNFERQHKLGLLFETTVGNGKLLVCSIDLLKLQDKPEARQLLYSLLSYMNSKDFQPTIELDKKLLNKLLSN